MATTPTSPPPKLLAQPILIAASIIIAILLIAGMTLLIFSVIDKKKSPLPSDIQNTISFSPLIVPGSNDNFSAHDYRYGPDETGQNILTYTVKNSSGTNIFVSQYPQPPQFVEITDYKEQFLNNVAQQYDTVQSSNGVIYLGRLTKLQNRQLGVMLDKGLLIFISPQSDLSSDEWRLLGNSLEII